MAYASHLAAMNACRKQFGSEWKEFAFVEKLDGEYHAQVKQILDRSQAINSLMTDRAGAFEFPQSRAEKSDAIQAFFASRPRPEIDPEFDEAELEAMRQEADEKANAAASEETLKNGKIWIRLSSIPGPTKAVWHIADEMIAADPQASRQQIQDECVRRGIASGTARTQYQAWKKANDNSRANEAAAIEASKRFNGH